MDVSISDQAEEVLSQSIRHGAQGRRKREHKMPTSIEICALASLSTGENLNLMTAR
jgi:hypothetical protein